MAVIKPVVADPQLRRAAFGFTSFSIAEHASWLAIIVFAYDRGGVGEAGLVAFVQLVPAAVVAPFGGYAADRFPRERALAFGFAVQTLTLALTATAMVTDAPPWVVYLTAALAAMSMTLSRPALAAVTPSLVQTAEQLTAANVMTSLAEQFGLFAGPAAAAFVLIGGSPASVFFASAGMTALAAVVSRRLQLRSVIVEFDEGEDDVSTSVAELSAGLRLIRADGNTRMLMGLMALSFVVEGALDVAFVAIAIDLIGRSDSTAGVFATAVGLGGAAGALAAVSLVGRMRLTWPLALGIAAGGVSVAALASGAALPVLIGLFAIQGAAVAVSDVAGRTMLQGLTSDDVLARVFGVLEGVTMLSYAAGSLIFAGLTKAFGVRGALLGLGLAPLLFLALRLRRLLAVDAERRPADPELVALVRSVPIFAPLPPYAIEQLLLNLAREQLGPKEVVMQRGDVGEHFYLIEDGSVEIDTGEVQRTIEGAGAFFGEIALLHDVPRTASIQTGAAGATLLSLERDVFLAAVTGQARSLSRVTSVADRRLADRPDDP